MKRNKLERKLDEYNHTMELIRTIIPVAILMPTSSYIGETYMSKITVELNKKTLSEV